MVGLVTPMIYSRLGRPDLVASGVAIECVVIIWGVVGLEGGRPVGGRGSKVLQCSSILFPGLMAGAPNLLVVDRRWWDAVPVAHVVAVDGLVARSSGPNGGGNNVRISSGSRGRDRSRSVCLSVGSLRTVQSSNVWKGLWGASAGGVLWVSGFSTRFDVDDIPFGGA